MIDSIQLPFSKRDKKKREIEILEKATELFAEHGYQGASLAQVAKAVGLTEQGVLHYFPSKVHLLQGVLEEHEQREVEKFFPLFTAAIANTGELLQVVETVVEENEKVPGMVQLFTMLVSESIRSDHPSHDYFVNRYRQARAAYVHQFLRLNQGKMRAGVDPEMLAALIMAVMDGLQIQWLLDPDKIDMSAAFRLFTRAIAALLKDA